MTSNRTWLVGSAIAAVAVYALLWIGYLQQWAWLVALDSAALEALYRYGSVRPAWVTAWEVFCIVLGPWAFRLAAVVLIVFALLRRRAHMAMFLLVTIVLSGPLTEAAKSLADRPRPATALVPELSTAFPSGHALVVLVSVLALLVLAWPVLRPPLRGWLTVIGAMVVVGIGVGRVVLNVHHPSDVLAGWALGWAYFVACLLLVGPRPRVRAADERPAVPDSAR